MALAMQGQAAPIQGAENEAAAPLRAPDKNVPKPSRRALKVRRHTTAAKMSNPHSNPSSTSSGSEEGNSGRPDLSPSKSKSGNEPLS